MKAKCPRCSIGCPQCHQGYIEVTFPEPATSRRYYITCDECGTEAGGGFVMKDVTEPRKASPFAICPACGSQKLTSRFAEEAK